MSKKKTLILGASSNPERYSYLALKSLLDKGYEVELLGKKVGTVMDKNIEKEAELHSGIHTITLYINKLHQKEYYKYILDLHPKRVIFNPGAENPELAQILAKNNIENINACTLVMLKTGQF